MLPGTTLANLVTDDLFLHFNMVLFFSTSNSWHTRIFRVPVICRRAPAVQQGGSGAFTRHDLSQALHILAWRHWRMHYIVLFFHLVLCLPLHLYPLIPLKDSLYKHLYRFNALYFILFTILYLPNAFIFRLSYLIRRRFSSSHPVVTERFEKDYHP